MIAMQCSDAKRRFGSLIDMAQKEPILLEKYGKPFVVVLSYENYVDMKEVHENVNK